ncbi:DUF6325 family protein [Cellulomonas biazotea]|uniref:DUF1269 domain-containing protein n=1 Tax=Cellulomonas biazotea TaxID=1709 RepID=A0A402DRD9_9CELL|nr:DUF6325 family protein [Cellulomonas biazotea]GCE76687.1 hypothetical protein CBZ_17430 [Cellulomonas biazotea]
MAGGVVEITVVGTLPPTLLLGARARGVRGARRLTVMDGSVDDEAALLGLLEQTFALGLELVALRRAPAAPRQRGALAVTLVVAGGVGDVALSMLDQLHGTRRTPCTALEVRQEDAADLARWLPGRGFPVLATAAPRPPVAGDAPDRAHDESDEPVDPSRGHGARAHVRSRREEGDVEDTTEELGPIDYIVVEFPQNKLDGTAFPLLVDLVEKGIIRVLDLVFVEKDEQGEVRALELHEAEQGGADLSYFEGASSGLLGDDDVAEAAAALTNGSAAGILVFENRWAAPFASALRRGGGQLVASGRIPVQAVLAALDALDAA